MTPRSAPFGRTPRFCVVVLTILGATLAASPARAQHAGPGPLFIVGGGPQPDGLVQRFVDLAGGPEHARIAVIPLAGSDPEASGAGKVDHFAEFGAEAFVLLTDGEAATRAATVARLDEATAVWFTGGSQSRITGALDGTPLLSALRRRHREGLPIGGTSAGAAIMSPLMITGSQYDPEADSIGYYGDEFPRIARETIEVVPGLAFLDGIVIDQHFVRRERHNRLLSVVLEHPDHVGAGIDESTALEVGPDGVWHVHGASVVVVYDAREAAILGPDSAVPGAAGITLHLLTAGTRYDPGAGPGARPELP